MAVDKYQWYAGWNNSSSLATLSIQPTAPCPGILYSVVTFAGPGYKYLDGKSGELRYTSGLSPTDFNTLVTAFSLDPDSGTAYVKGTLRYRKNDDTYANYNVILYYPTNGQQIQRGLGRWQGCVFPFVIIGAAS